MAERQNGLAFESLDGEVEISVRNRGEYETEGIRERGVRGAWEWRKEVCWGEKGRKLVSRPAGRTGR